MNILAIILIEIFKRYMENTMIVFNNVSYTYREIMYASYYVSNNLKKLSDKSIRIALIADNSVEWIIVFIAVILSNKKLILFSPRLSITKLKYVVTNSKANILITDLDLVTSDFPLLHSIINIRNIKIITEETIFNSETTIQTSNLIVYTPRELKEVSISYKEIGKTLSSLDKEKIFRKSTYYVAYQEFTYNYVLTVLLPFLNGVKIVIPDNNFEIPIDNHECEVIILNGYQFEELWREHIEPSDDIFLKFLRDFRFNRVKNWIVKRNLKKLFPNIETLIILNSSINLQIEATLKKIKFPYTITYGTIETCGISTYSKPKEFVLGSCGKLLTDYPYHIEELSNDNWIVNGNNILFFQNRKDEVITTEYGFTITRDVERILKNLPLVTDCILVQSNKTLQLLVNIDLNYVDSENMKLHDVYELLNNCIRQINDKVHTFEKISNVIIDLIKFKRDSYGRILRKYYTLQ